MLPFSHGVVLSEAANRRGPGMEVSEAARSRGIISRGPGAV